MLLKPFICYVAGVVSTALAVSAGSGHWGLGCFFAGLLTCLVLQGWYLSNAQRAAQACRFILRVVGPSQFTLSVPEPRKPTKRERANRELEAWARINSPRIAQRAAEQKQRLAAMPSTDPNYDFLNDPELCG